MSFTFDFIERIASGYSRTRIVDGVGVIDRFGFYNNATHSQLNLIKNAFKRNGATSINIYTNSANKVMGRILEGRIKSGRTLFGLSVERRAISGYILKGKI